MRMNGSCGGRSVGRGSRANRRHRAETAWGQRPGSVPDPQPQSWTPDDRKPRPEGDAVRIRTWWKAVHAMRHADSGAEDRPRRTAHVLVPPVSAGTGGVKHGWRRPHVVSAFRRTL